MGVAGDLLLAVVGVVLVAAAPIEIAFGTLVAFWLLVPGSLVVPGAPHIVLVDAAVLDVFALRLLLKSGLPGEPKGSAYALGPVHAALAFLLAIGFLDGVVLAPRSTSLAGDLHGWLYLFHLGVLFVVVLAAVRTIGVWRAVRIVVAVLLVSVAIAVGEWITGRGWSAFFFEHLPANYLGVGAVGLIKRGSHVRPQVAAQFAVEYAWVLTMFLPLVIYAAIRTVRNVGRRARFALLIPPAVVLGVALTATRGAELAIPFMILLFVVLGGAGRSLRRWLAAFVGMGLFVAIVAPSFVTKAFSIGAATDPLSVRFDRLPYLFSQVLSHRFTGIGFSGVTSVFGGLDNAYALIYASIGVVGLVAWVALFATAGTAVSRPLLRPSGDDSRLVGAACLTGIVGIFAAAFTFDLPHTVQSPWGLIFLAAIGAAGAERVPRMARAKRRWSLRLALPVAGVAAGFGLLAVVPTSASETLSVQTVAPWVIALSKAPVSPYQGTTLVDVLCSAVTNPDTIAPGTDVKCVQANLFRPLSDRGLALVTISGPTRAAVQSEAVRAFTPIFAVMPMAGGPSGPIGVGKPAWAVTAPVWLGLAGFIIMLLVPPLGRPRHRRRTPALATVDS